MIQNRIQELYADLISECKAAWGVNLLHVGHNNALMKLRRASDNVEMNIYRQGIFLNRDRGEQFDPTKTSSYARVWNDQIYPYVDATQTVSSKQPKLTFGSLPPTSALYFDGTDDLFFVPDHSKLQFVSSGYTIICDINSLAFENNKAIFAKGVSPNVSIPYRMYTVGTQGSPGSAFRFDIAQSGMTYYVDSGKAINDNEFHFVACVRDRTNQLVKMSVDGEDFTTASDGGISESQTGDMYIGRAVNPASLFFKGYLNFVAIFGKAMNLDEIKILNELAVSYRVQ